MLVDKDGIITKEKILVKNFNNHYINIAENCSDTKPNVLVDHHSNFGNIVNIISEHKNHPNILKIKNKIRFNKFNTSTDPFCQVTTGRVK